MIESLEQRRLLSFAVTGGVLTVTGTSGVDHILVRRDGTNLSIVQNGVTKTTPAAAVKKIVVNALAGNDDITLAIGPDHGINLPSTLNGGDGNDKLVGGDGADVLNGGNNDDILVGGHGSDVFNGGAGIDTADYHQAIAKLSVTLDNVANDGAIGDATHPAEKDNVHGDVENIVGGGGADKLVGNASNNKLVGGPGNDTLIGNDGKDTLDGGPGADSLSGGNGDDLLLGHDNGKDSLDGGSGTDSASTDVSDVLTSIEKKNTQPPPPPQPPQPPRPPKPVAT